MREGAFGLPLCPPQPTPSAAAYISGCGAFPALGRNGAEVKASHGGELRLSAVLWAFINDITKGTTETTFSLYSTVTRAQIVSFLYRNFVK